MTRVLMLGLALAMHSSLALATGVIYGSSERRHEKMCEVLLRGDLPPYPREAIEGLFNRTFYMSWINQSATPAAYSKLGLNVLTEKELRELRLYVSRTPGPEIFANLFGVADRLVSGLAFSESRQTLWHDANLEPTEILALAGFVEGPDREGVMTYVRATVGLDRIFAELGLQFPCSLAEKYSSEPEKRLSRVITDRASLCQVDILSFSRHR